MGFNLIEHQHQKVNRSSSLNALAIFGQLLVLPRSLLDAGDAVTRS
jgi:hypothetical protein